MPRTSRTRMKLFAKHINALKQPLLQEADLASCFLLAMHDAGDLEDTETIAPSEFRQDYRRFRNDLIDFGGIRPYPETDQGNASGYLVGLADQMTPEQEVCSLDPFCYISHLSAMSWHGLTQRLPKSTFITRPSKDLWRTLSHSRLQKRLGDLMPLYEQIGFPSYRPLDADKVGGSRLHAWSSKRLDKGYSASFKYAEERKVRVATLGRCFLDMVRKPDLCGGINHVMDVFDEHASDHINAILTELDTHGNAVEQARVGYLLEQADPEAAYNPVLERWASKVSRGGSRKLDPSEDYSDIYSEKWALSINA